MDRRGRSRILRAFIPDDRTGHRTVGQEAHAAPVSRTSSSWKTSGLLVMARAIAAGRAPVKNVG